MLRSTATRSLVKSLAKAPASRSSYSAASGIVPASSAIRQLTTRRSRVLAPLAHPANSLRYATKAEPPFDRIDEKAEQKLGAKVLEQHPEDVSLGSSVRPVFEERTPHEDDMLGGIKGDMKTIKETFALTDVPKESLYIGAAGVLPYAATSLSTVVLAYDINHAHATGTGLLFTPETAHQLLDIITPVQIGYGAVIISFLGAIHWGLEYAGYGGHHSYNRYMYGVIAPAVAWPTTFMPVEYALITQFVAFNFLYFADARATVRGWFPPWYSTYRFVLTFFVGASIVISLVGRGQISRKDAALKSPVDYMREERGAQMYEQEREEREKRRALAAEQEEGEDEEEDGEEEKEEEDSDDEEGKDEKSKND